MHLLPTNLAKLADATAENNRWACSAVHVRLHGDQTYIAEATDTKIAVRVTGECTNDPAEFPELPGMSDAPNGHIDGLIPGSIWQSVFNSASKKTRRLSKPVLRNVAVKIGKEVATLGYTDLDSFPVERTRLVEGKFPPLADVFPKQPPAFKFTFDGNLMCTLIKTVSEFADSSKEPVLELSLFKNSSCMVVTTQNKTQKASGLILAMSSKEAKVDEDEDKTDDESDPQAERVKQLEKDNEDLKRLLHSAEQREKAKETKYHEIASLLDERDDTIEKLKAEIRKGTKYEFESIN